MAKFFTNIYDYFLRHKLLMWIILVGSTLLMSLAALKVRYVEDITNFFPKQEQDISLIFDHLPAKDKFVVMFSYKVQDEPTAMQGDPTQGDPTPTQDAITQKLIAAAQEFTTDIEQNKTFENLATLSSGVDFSMIENMSGFVYDNLPLLLDDEDYSNLDSLVSQKAIKERLLSNYDNLISPIGGYISDYIYKDPLGLASKALSQLQNQGNTVSYRIIEGYIFSKEENTLLCYISPNGKLSSRSTGQLIDIIEASIKSVNTKHIDVKAEYFGGGAVAAYNAKQIKRDTMITMNIAILMVVIIISLAFKNKYTILLVIAPVVYGALFALAMIYLINGGISLIAVGSGSVIFGIALSYSIHILAHTKHSRDIKQLIADLAYPLTIGSFTTIGAFVGLLFTNSALLQDFGLFSSLTLVGTTLFALIFLPHFLSIKKEKGSENKLLSFVDRISKIRFDRNKILVITILLITLISGIFFSKVGFDSDMMKLNYEPKHLREAEDRLNRFIDTDSSESTILFIASSPNSAQAVSKYNKLCSLLDSLQLKGKIESYSSINSFVLSDSLQKLRLEKWDKFWVEHNANKICKQIDHQAVQIGFESGAYSAFESIATKDYSALKYNNGSTENKLFSDWIKSNESICMFIAQVKLSEENKAEVYDIISSQSGSIAADRAFFAGKMAQDVNNNFYLILYISGILIFLALMLSYGRIELTLISFLPMFISWVIILGIMSLLGIEFNIVTIILSTFIFGIGDDFSIFIMDGLLNEYRDKTRVLTQHKTAIFFSAFTIIVGMGALIFAKHPAMHSLGLISLVGIVVVVLVAYTIQPFIFRLFISTPTHKGGFPFTIFSFLNTLYAFGLFVIGCLAIKTIIILIHLIPIGKKRRKAFVHGVTRWFIYVFLRIMVTTKTININEYKETFKKPAVIIANHQSFIDILLLLSLNNKLIMVTNGWVWRSPFFGKIVRYLDFYHTGDGYEALADSLKEKIEDGYSIIVFPEGTRSADRKIKRFHKGAFYLAEQLKLDILPILLYGTGLVSSKRQPLYIKHGFLISKILPRISVGSTELEKGHNESMHNESGYRESGYRERAKNISRYFKNEYDKLYEEYNRVCNPYFKDAIIKNYTYKGPVLEWYMKIKLRMENWYEAYDKLLPRTGYIVDLGCGYGALTYMLSMLSDKRKITAVDYDFKKIELADNCFSKNENMEFIHADIRKYDIPKADAYVISDVLHYIDYEAQRIIIEKCIDSLNYGGVFIIRDGDTSVKEKHQRTEQTEKWSTKIVKFNKTDGPLCFLSRDMIAEIALQKSMQIEIIESNSSNSNTLFVLRHKQE